MLYWTQKRIFSKNTVIIAHNNCMYLHKSGDRDSRRRPSSLQNGERELGTIMRYNSESIVVDFQL